MTAAAQTLPQGHSSWRDLFFATQWRGRRYLLSPFLDFFMVGGGALMTIALVGLLVPMDIDKSNVELSAYIAAAFLLLAYIVNYPHFAVSYQLLYGNYRSRLTRFKGSQMWWRYLIAGTIVPILLLSYIAFALLFRSEPMFVLAAHAMAFFVGWHYTKQAYGVFIVLSVLKKNFYSALERRILVANSYVMWITAWLGASYRVTQERYYIPIKNIAVPEELMVSVTILATLTSLAALGTIAHHWRKSGQRPSLTGLTGYLSMYYLLALLFLTHPKFWTMAPFFHSLQYFLFIIAYKRGEARSHRREAANERQIKKIYQSLIMFFATAIFIGFMFYQTVPGLLDAYQSRYGNPLFPGIFLFCFIAFTNIHHYFIDNVIWRRENTEVGEYFFGAAKPAPAPAADIKGV